VVEQIEQLHLHLIGMILPTSILSRRRFVQTPAFHDFEKQGRTDDNSGGAVDPAVIHLRTQSCVAWAHMAAVVTASSNHIRRFGISAIRENCSVIMMVMG